MKRFFMSKETGLNFFLTTKEIDFYYVFKKYFTFKRMAIICIFLQQNLS